MPQEFDTTELLNAAALLVEQAKQQGENAEKAAAALKGEQAALKNIKGDLSKILSALVAESIKKTQEQQAAQLSPAVAELRSVTGALYRARDEISRNVLWMYFGIMAVFAAAFVGFLFLFVPSMDEIRERKTLLENLNAAIEHKQGISELKTSRCKGQLCVKVNPKKCGYTVKDAKGEYCIADLR